MVSRIVAGIFFITVVMIAVGVAASVTSESGQKANIESIISDSNEKGIVVTLSRKMPFQLIQVDKKELFLAVKNGDFEKTMPVISADDALVASISTDRLPGNIIGVVIHMKKPVVHDSTEWDDTSGHVMVRLK